MYQAAISVLKRKKSGRLAESYRTVAGATRQQRTRSRDSRQAVTTTIAHGRVLPDPCGRGCHGFRIARKNGHRTLTISVLMTLHIFSFRYYHCSSPFSANGHSCPAQPQGQLLAVPCSEMCAMHGTSADTTTFLASPQLHYENGVSPGLSRVARGTMAERRRTLVPEYGIVQGLGYQDIM
ncbi:hypothetical protein N656DRAFT_535319 [Canariomyces notabilis]|uniref:Uncharacterized protein n=1 Tax=Canariomyces notabilis TaxID=2074819 RepID=A0AAN6THG6_9PEZI|nr:hypothetical protein N656DRAFT_535319 [Canariomyces arenarius]